jgi:hypothetical protein
MPTLTFRINDKCSGILRVPGVPITTIEGRLIGEQINFNNNTYEELQMRRKAEILQYKKIETTLQNKKQLYASVSKGVGSFYSNAQIERLVKLQDLNNEIESCNIIRYTPASNSGIKGEYKMLYYYNRNIPLIKRNDQLTLGS